MQPVILEHFRNSVFRKFPPPGKRILEIGALSEADQTLLSIFASSDQDYELTGINLDAPKNCSSTSLGYRLLQCNANDMSIFSDGYFDAVICSSVFNNDRFFWRSLEEIHRILRPEGLFYTNVPVFSGGFHKLRLKRFLYRAAQKLFPANVKDWLIALSENSWLSAVATYHYSPTPEDYYRFSESSVKAVVMQGYELIHCEKILYPPRVIAVGKKRAE